MPATTSAGTSSSSTARCVVAFGGMALKNNDVGRRRHREHIARGRLRAARRRGVEFHLISPLRDDLPAEVAARLASGRPGHRRRADARPRAHAGRPRACTTALSSTGTPSATTGSSAICSADADGQPKDARVGRRDLRHCRPTTSRALARRMAGRRTLVTVLPVAAARRARRAAGLDGHRPGRAARPDRACRAAASATATARWATTGKPPSPCRCRRCRRAATASPTSSRSRGSPTCCSHPGGTFDYDGAAPAPIPTSGSSTGPAATRSTTIRT